MKPPALDGRGHGAPTGGQAAASRKNLVPKREIPGMSQGPDIFDRKHLPVFKPDLDGD